jgi:hypothetical protein
MALLPAATMVQLSRLRLPLKACFLAQVRPLAPSQRWHGCRGLKKRDPGTVQRARTVAAQQWHCSCAPPRCPRARHTKYGCIE